MANSVGALIIRLTHTGVYADGRPNTASVTIYDLDQDILKKNRARSVPVPPGGFVDIPMSSETLISYSRGSIYGLTQQGLIRAELILQFRDRDHFGGSTGQGQTLRSGVPNVERVGGVLRLVIPDNNPPTYVDSAGYLVGESVTLSGLTGAFRFFNGNHTISAVAPATGLSGAQVGSYLVEILAPGSDIAAVTHGAGVALQLTEGRITVEFTSDGDLGGLGTNVFGYIAGQLFPSTGGGAGTISVEDEGVLIDPATTLLNFVGAGVTASSAGPGSVDVVISGGGGSPSDASYVVLSANPSLTDERVLTAGVGISLVDGGAGGLVTLSSTLSLAEVLTNGNATAGSSLVISSGDQISGQTDLVLSPGSNPGDTVVIDGLTWPSADGAPGDVLTTDGAGSLFFSAPPAASVSDTISQANHGFSVGNAIFFDGALWQLAAANDPATLGTHLVSEVPDVNTFVATQAGRVTTLAGLTSGEYYFVSATVPGALTTVDPATTNPIFYSNPLLFADSVTSGWVLPWQAYGPGSGAAGGLTIQDEGVLVDPGTVLINFVGAGVTATAISAGQVEVSIPGLSASPSLSSTLSYDGQGRLEEITYSDTSVKTFTYDGQGRLSTVVYLGETKTLTYNPDGSLAAVTVT